MLECDVQLPTIYINIDGETSGLSGGCNVTRTWMERLVDYQAVVTLQEHGWRD